MRLTRYLFRPGLIAVLFSILSAGYLAYQPKQPQLQPPDARSAGFKIVTDEYLTVVGEGRILDEDTQRATIRLGVGGTLDGALSRLGLAPDIRARTLASTAN